MRVGIDAHILGKNKGGVERYVRNLVDLLPRMAPHNEYIFFVGKHWKGQNRYYRNVKYCKLLVSDPLFQRSVILPFLSMRFNLDVLHVQRIAPLFCGTNVVVTVHDLVLERNKKQYNSLRDRIVRVLTPYTMRTAKRIITVSNAVRNQILDKYRLPDRKVVSVYNGIDHSFFRSEPKCHNNKERLGNVKHNNPYILYVGAIEPRKNLEVVIEALRVFLDTEDLAVNFVIAGGIRNGRYYDALLKLTRRCSLENHVKFKGYITDEEYLRLLREAKLFIAPSVDEGFDLPPLEAMASEVPVICSDIKVHRELFSDCAVFFDSGSARMLYLKIRELWFDEEKTRAIQKKGLEQARKFTWETTVCKIAQIYSETGRHSRD